MEALDLHEHLLTFIDWQSKHQNEEEEEEEEEEEDEDENEEDDLITPTQYLRLYCHRCSGEIDPLDLQYRGYYKCSESCDYVLHKLCAEELPATLIHPSHRAHALILQRRNASWFCDICWSDHGPDDLIYCCSECYFDVDLICAAALEQTRIRFNHPCHPHPLVGVSINDILCECNACGRKHEGVFYHCITCVGYLIHHDCATLPRKLLVQRATNDRFTHPHQLTLSYFLRSKFRPKCRICDKAFSQQLWLYECEKCRYYAHVDCATSRREPFMSIFSAPGLGRITKNFEDVDHPDLLHLPFLDESCNLLQHQFCKEMRHGLINHEVNLKHPCHQHPLSPFHLEINGVAKPTSSSIKSLSLHNPMKKIQLLCNGCLRPITTVPFYKCLEEDDKCNFILHEWCTRLPTQLENHPCHQQHTLVLMPKVHRKFFGVFRCKICQLFCNGFSYGCDKCDYYIDVNCAFMPDKVTHEAHKNHLLFRRMTSYGRGICRACLWDISKDGISFSCDSCDFDLHPECALLLPGTIRHKYDKHPMHLSYLPIENHKSEYFCEICEEEFYPRQWFYHCSKCVQPQSMHSACAPLILGSEQHVHFEYWRCVYEFINIKFGGVLNIEHHPHPLSFVQGIETDGDCSDCESFLQFYMIFKCSQCKFAVHFKCAKKLSN